VLPEILDDGITSLRTIGGSEPWADKVSPSLWRVSGAILCREMLFTSLVGCFNMRLVDAIA
jgi:hypothetical protein